MFSADGIISGGFVKTGIGADFISFSTTGGAMSDSQT